MFWMRKRKVENKAREVSDHELADEAPVVFVEDPTGPEIDFDDVVDMVSDLIAWFD